MAEGRTQVEALLAPFLAPRFRVVLPYVLIGVSVVVWAAVGLGPFSGQASPPINGDFEAQRHWMEITQHLPPREWYYYDLQYWGLDYPPLTAYHSWLCGKIGTIFGDKSWFALDFSRGIETDEVKAFMRATAIVSQLVTYVPGVLLFTQLFSRRKGLDTSVALLLFPSLVIIDHGHFQYNAVMLGFFALSVYELINMRLVRSSFWFILSLFFKQMALYYAPVIFAAILATCVSPRLNIWRLASVGSCVVGTSIVLLGPFIPDNLAQVVFRVFPFARGLWEDKVANLWCTLNTVVKLKLLFEPEQLQRLALATTLIGILPACIAAFVIFKRPKSDKRLVVTAFASSAWSFYLFSFQVHEKSVLLPLMPTTMALALPTVSPDADALVLWINNIAYFSMWPLLQREKLGLQYVALLVLWNWLLSTPKRMPVTIFNRLIVLGSYAAIGTVLVAERLSLVPSHILASLPDLWSVINVTISFGCFAYFWLWQTASMLYSVYTN